MTYDLTVRLPKRGGGILQFREFLDFCRALEPVDSPSRVLVDLANVRFAHPSGMAPIVAVIRDLTEKGWVFDVALPQDDFIAGYFEMAGWIAGITGELSEAGGAVPGSTFIPLSTYSNASELNPLLTDAVKHFTQHSVFGPGVHEGIEWSLYEVADNVLNHAGGAPGWLQLAEQPKKHLIEIVVVDCGQGICSSLHARFPDLADDSKAIERAVEKGVTRDPSVGQGNGLAGTLRIAVAANGWVNIHSGRGHLRYMPDTDVHADRGVGRSPTGASQHLYVDEGPRHQGTVVSLTLPTAGRIDVAGALWGNKPASVLETAYEAGHGESVTFEVAVEASGFGNRESARPLRQRLHNLMNIFEGERIIVDFGGVNLVSASFADEFIARLVKEVGLASFFQRVQLANMNDLVRRTMDAVLEQRLGS